MLSAARWLTVAHRVSLEFRRSPIPASAPPRPVATRRGVGTPNLSRGLGTAAGMADPDGVADARFDASGVEIEIPLPPPIGTKRLQRPADEPAGKALARLRATVEKARKKTASKKKTDGAGDGDAASPPPPIATLRETSSDVALDPETRNVDAWVSGRTLVVDGVGSFRVRVNAPSLESVAVAGYPVVGSPLVAAPFGLRHCDEDEDLAYEWRRRLTRDDTGGADAESRGANAAGNGVTSDVLVGVGRAYVPTCADEGHFLVVTATPQPPRGDDAPCGAPASFATARATAAARPRPDAEKRMARFVPSTTTTAEERVPLPKSNTIESDVAEDASVVRIMTYNALADAYSHTWASLYPYLSAANADPHARLPLAMQDVLLASPEIVALQEVDRKWYGEFWVPQMRAAGYIPAGPLAEKTGLTREGCCVFVKADKWRVVEVTVVSLKDPGPMPEEEATKAFMRTQPHLREALEKISTVGLVAKLEPAPGARNDARRPLVVANAHLFFHPGATHVRALQTRWLLRHAQKAREAHARVNTLPKSTSGRSGDRSGDETRNDDATRRTVGLVVCGDFNAEPFDAAARFAKDGALSAGDADWALGSVFRWGGTSSRAAAAELASMSSAVSPSETAERDERGDVDGDPAATHQKLGRMAACWRACAETERGQRARCALIVAPSPDDPNDPDDPDDPFVIARHHARNGCTFKTCAYVAAWTYRRDAGMPPGVTLAGVARAPWPGAEPSQSPGPDSGGGGGGEPARRAGMGPEWARGDVPASAPGCDASGDASPSAANAGGGEEKAADLAEDEDFEKLTASAVESDVAAATSAARKALDAHKEVLRAVSASALKLEREAMGALDDKNAESGGWVAAEIGLSAMHMRHPLKLISACGDPEWTNFVGGFRGALDYVWCDTSDDSPFGAAVVPVAHALMPPLEAVTRQTALPNEQFPSDHLPMVADVRFVAR